MYIGHMCCWCIYNVHCVCVCVCVCVCSVYKPNIHDAIWSHAIYKPQRVHYRIAWSYVAYNVSYRITFYSIRRD